MLYSLSGKWQADIGDGKIYQLNLPGTLDENKVGYKDTGSNQWHPDSELGNGDENFKEDAPIATRFTRKYTFEGTARLTRRLDFEEQPGKRTFLEAERARVLRLQVDGKEVENFLPASISTPHVFEVTGLVHGEHELALISDNSYLGLPHDAIVYSSAATDETQTNWNGVLGYIRLRVEESVFIEAVRVYPVKDELNIQIDICAGESWSGTVTIHSEAVKETVKKEVSVETGRTTIEINGLPLADDVKRWDEYEGNLYELTAALSNGSEKIVTYGVRDFGDNGEGRLALNRRTIFLRSEANCCEFPETGHPPMSVEEWTSVLQMYKDYGINCMRFHSHCPPEAAFTAADQMGMLMQPELSHWNPRDAFESDESYNYYRTEMLAIIRTLANHPSFVMMTWGNELQAGELGHERMRELLRLARSTDATRLYADGSNNHYGNNGCEAESDFYASQQYFDKHLRGIFANMEGYINNRYPDAKTNYDESMKALRETYKKPVFSFEVGQFEVLPDFDELEDFKGVSLPVNYQLIQKRVEERGLVDVWKKYVEATGELSGIGYREEVEAILRTEGMSGISLLGLQDFPGQGTALVGMLNSHLEPKPFSFAQPERFRSFFREQLPLVLLPKYTYENTETLMAQIQIANYGKQEIVGNLEYKLEGRMNGENICQSGVVAGEVICPVGKLTYAGTLEIALQYITKAARLNLTVNIGEIINTYPIWVYPPAHPVCPKDVYETQHFDEKARAILEAGGKVYLTPPSTREALPFSIQARFTTDFWSVGTFAGQEGSMGQLINDKHPLFADFPTEFHTNWQWWPMASQRAVILPQVYEAIITEMDSYAFLRPMAQLLECKCGNGKLMFSTMGLQDLQQYPEARALLASIYGYMASDEFAPKQMIEPDVIAELVWQEAEDK